MPRSSDLQDYGSGLSPVRLSDLTKRLGVLKNQLFIFVVMIVLVTDFFAALLLKTEGTISKVCGACMGGSTIIMFFSALVLYFYALFKLPGTQQEFMFEQSAQQTLRDHSRAKKRTARASSKTL